MHMRHQIALSALLVALVLPASAGAIENKEKTTAPVGGRPATAPPAPARGGGNFTPPAIRPPTPGTAVAPAGINLDTGDLGAAGDLIATPTDVLTPQLSETPDLTVLNLTPEEIEGLSPEEAILLSAQQQMKGELEKLDKLPKGIPSLFFTRKEHEDLSRLLTGFGDRAQVASLGIDAIDLDTAGVNSFAGVRELSLGGIFYNGASNWIIWLNKQRLTPDRLPKEITDLKVYKDYIEVKWFDGLTSQTQAIRLRPNQRFNLDTRSFAPG